MFIKKLARYYKSANNKEYINANMTSNQEAFAISVKNDDNCYCYCPKSIECIDPI